MIKPNPTNNKIHRDQATTNIKLIKIVKLKLPSSIIVVKKYIMEKIDQKSQHLVKVKGR